MRTALSRLSLVAGVIAGILIGMLIVAPHSPQVANPSGAEPARDSCDLDHLPQDEIQMLIVKALSRLVEQEALSTIGDANADEGFCERAVHTRKNVELGVKNIRRLLPSVKRWAMETIHQVTEGYNIKRKESVEVARLIRGVHRIVRSQGLRGMAAVRDDHPSEILIDPRYAPYLISDDEAVFVLAHELTHVAARSGKLTRFIEGVAENVSRIAHVQPTEGQKEDLACDFVGEMVLKRFITINPTNDPVAVRVSRVFGYESPGERFARAWEDFCASYNGDPGDESHLNQYGTIRALLALDPHLQSLMPMPSGSILSSARAQSAGCP